MSDQNRATVGHVPGGLGIGCSSLDRLRGGSDGNSTKFYFGSGDVGPKSLGDEALIQGSLKLPSRSMTDRHSCRACREEGVIGTFLNY